MKIYSIRYAETLYYREAVQAESEEEAKEIFQEMQLQMPDDVQVEYFEIEEYKAWAKTLMQSGCRPILGGTF